MSQHLMIESNNLSFGCFVCKCLKNQDRNGQIISFPCLERITLVQEVGIKHGGLITSSPAEVSMSQTYSTHTSYRMHTVLRFLPGLHILFSPHVMFFSST